VEKLIVAANHYNRSVFEVMQHIDKTDVKLNSGTVTKLQDFVTMIQSFQVLNQTLDAFELTDHVVKKSGLLTELKKEGTPEGITRIENVEELLNGMRDFVEGQKEIADATGSLAEFMEDVALATDMDNDKGSDDRVALMTIHLAKGLEFPYVYIVGLEEELFPNAMSLSSREDLEEERRLFYVAVTRAEKQVFLSYTQSRYRWGKLIDAEPSRFIEEIDENYIEFLSDPNEQRFKTLIDASIFDDDFDRSNVRLRKPAYQPAKTTSQPAKPVFQAPKNLKPVAKANSHQVIE